MSNAAPRSAWSALHEAAWALKLPAVDKLILLALTRHVDDCGRAWPSVGTLVRLTGAAESTVVLRIASLEKAGLVAVAGFVQRHGSEWRVYDDRPYTPGRGRLKLYRVLPGADLSGGGETSTEKGPTIGPIEAERVRQPDPIENAMGPTPGPFSGERVRQTPRKGSGSFGPNSPVNPNSPAPPSGGEAVAPRSTASSTGAGPPSPVTPSDVSNALRSVPDGLRSILERNLTPPAGAAPSSSEPPTAPPGDPERR